ncbi:hypothetical protein HYFRA_00008275 [Hymenoscyphus fraxineus]|uniref:Terpene synthase n=1 Tax=Hymenoscyphus fraxineus TaxID=746836 RepID=A0A9N9KN69_9HELO|nr:hypothetical protein HYFRA_00008275 [Hymenoscyphus fraxineus]
MIVSSTLKPQFGLLSRPFRSHVIPIAKQTRSPITFSQSRLLQTRTLRERHSGTLKLPDLFERWMSRIPIVHPNYKTVTDQSVEWIAGRSRICGYDRQQIDKLHRVNFGYWPAIMVPDVSEERLGVVADSIVWVFLFDDLLDEGPMRRDYKKRIEYASDMMSVLTNPQPKHTFPPSSQPMKIVLADIYNRLLENSEYPLGATTRWSERLLHYIKSVQSSVIFEPSKGLEDSLRRYMEYKADINGIPPLFSAVELASSLHIPDEVFEHPAMRALERVGQDMETLQAHQLPKNSLYKLTMVSQQNGYHENIIWLLGHHGLSVQESYDEVQVLLRGCFKAWYLALAELPSWGEAVDRDVGRYIRGIENVVLGLAHFSFQTPRYFGCHREEVRRTRELKWSDIEVLYTAFTSERK